MDPILAAASVFSADLAVGNSCYGPIREISFLNRVEIFNSFGNVENSFRKSILGNISATKSEQISSLFAALNKCFTTAILGVESRRELCGYIIASLRELAPLVGKSSDYDTFIFILQLIEKQKENAFLIFAEGGFKLVKLSQFNAYTKMKRKRPKDFRHWLEEHHIDMTKLPNGKKNDHPSNLVNCYYVLHFLAHIILANNNKEDKSHNGIIALMAKKLLKVYGKHITRGPYTKKKKVDPVAQAILKAERKAANKARQKKTAAATKSLRESGWTEAQKLAHKLERAAALKANRLKRRKKQQIKHDEWLAALSEAERPFAKLKPLYEHHLAKMTEEQRLASRWKTKRRDLRSNETTIFKTSQT
jgi:hypothetical protein